MPCVAGHTKVPVPNCRLWLVRVSSTNIASGRSSKPRHWQTGGGEGGGAGGGGRGVCTA